MSAKQPVKFGDICQEVKLTTKDAIADGYDKYIGLEHLDSGSLKIKRWGSIAEDKPSFNRVFKKGHILFGKRRPYLKKAAIAEFDGICSGDIVVMAPKGDLMLPELLPFIVQSEKFWDWAVKTSSGSLSPRTKFQSLSEFQLDTDILSRQKKLLDIFEHLRVVQNSSDRLEHAFSILKDNFLKKRLLPADVNPYKVKSFKDIEMPSNFNYYRLKDIAKIYSGATPLRSKSELYYSKEKSGINWIKTLDLNEDELYESEEKITNTALNECSVQLMPEGTVLLAMYGGFNQIGRTSLLKAAATTNQAISSIVCNKIILPEYCLLWLQSFRFLWRRYAASSRKDPNITKFDIENFPIWIPDMAYQKSTIDAYKTLKTVKNEHVNLQNQRLSLLTALLNN